MAQSDTKPLSEQRLVIVRATTPEQIDTIVDNSNGLLVCEPRLNEPMLAQVTKEQEAALKAAGLGATLFHSNAQAYLDSIWNRTMSERALRAADWYGAYHTLEEFGTKLDEIVASRPDLAVPVTLGTGLEGRPLRGVRLSSPDLPGNPRANRPTLFVIGGQHAREWVGPATVIYALDQMVAEYDTNQRVHTLLDRLEIVLVPIANPDGYAYTWVSSNTRLWRKNRRANNSSGLVVGVDNNRDWGFMWGLSGSSSNTGNETYHGLSPWSEPESAAIRDFCVANPNIIAAIDVHTYGQLLMGPWGHTTTRCEDDAKFTSLLTTWRNAILSVYSTPFTIGPVSTTIYVVSGGSTDWWYGARGLLGITSELRNGAGFTPDANTIRPNAEENYEGLLAVGEAILPAIRIRSTSTYEPWVPADEPNHVSVVVEAGTQEPELSSVRLMASVDGGPFVEQPLVQNGSGFEGVTPSMRCGSVVRFYIEATSTTGTVVHYPPVRWIEQRSAHTIDAARFDGETDTGWTIDPASTATAGGWERGVPEATTAQSGEDSDDAGSSGWFTGLAAGANADANDLDGGSTILWTPSFSLLAPSGMTSLEATLSYWRYLSASGTQDRFVATLVSPTMTQPIDYQMGSSPAQRYSVSGGFVPHASCRLRFEANDVSPDSTVEAGLDDLHVAMRVCRRSADMNGDAGVTIDDLLQFLLAFEQGTLAADYSNDEAVTIDDLLIYLAAFGDGY